MGIETTLFGGPPELGNVTKLANSQIGFMNIFALPLFDSVTDILPPMRFTVNQIKANQEVWKQRIEEEKIKEASSPSKGTEEQAEGWQSPRSASPDRTTFRGTEMNSHPEGLPASGVEPHNPNSPPLNTTQGTPDVPILSTAESTSEPASLKSVSPPVIANQTLNFSSPASINFLNEPTGKQESSHEDSSRLVAHAISTEDLGSAIQARRTTNGWPQPAYKSKLEAELPTFTRLSNGNFSRPMSQRHSSATRSSAPSGAPTMASVNPTSPTETQATSLLERGSESDLSADDNRPSSGYSGAVRGSSAYSSGYSSYSRGTNGYAMDPTPSLHYIKNANGHIVESVATHRGDQKILKPKRSRSRFFPPWFSKKNRSADFVQTEQK